MTRSDEHGYVVDDGDVLTEEVVHVPAGVADLVEAVEHQGETFVADVPDWDKPDPA
jgi:hypothetical protein